MGYINIDLYQFLISLGGIILGLAIDRDILRNWGSIRVSKLSKLEKCLVYSRLNDVVPKHVMVYNPRSNK